MQELSEVVNIGKILESQLKSVGIEDFDSLCKLGSQEAWLKIRSIDDSACINKLCALEGAIQGIRWHDLDASKKAELKEFCNQFK